MSALKHWSEKVEQGITQEDGMSCSNIHQQPQVLTLNYYASAIHDGTAIVWKGSVSYEWAKRL